MFTNRCCVGEMRMRRRMEERRWGEKKEFFIRTLHAVMEQNCLLWKKQCNFSLSVHLCHLTVWFRMKYILFCISLHGKNVNSSPDSAQTRLNDFILEIQKHKIHDKSSYLWFKTYATYKRVSWCPKLQALHHVHCLESKHPNMHLSYLSNQPPCFFFLFFLNLMKIFLPLI